MPIFLGGHFRSRRKFVFPVFTFVCLQFSREKCNLKGMHSPEESAVPVYCNESVTHVALSNPVVVTIQKSLCRTWSHLYAYNETQRRGLKFVMRSNLSLQLLTRAYVQIFIYLFSFQTWCKDWKSKVLLMNLQMYIQ